MMSKLETAQEFIKGFEKMVVVSNGKEYILSTKEEDKDLIDPIFKGEEGPSQEGDISFIGTIGIVTKVGHCEAPHCKREHVLNTDSRTMGSGRYGMQIKNIGCIVQTLAQMEHLDIEEVLDHITDSLIQKGALEKADVAFKDTGKSLIKMLLDSVKEMGIEVQTEDKLNDEKLQ